jgi:hypothetical protein
VCFASTIGDVYAHTSDDAANLAMDVLGEALGT